MHSVPIFYLFFNGVQDFLADPLLHLCITRAFAGQTLQLVHIFVHPLIFSLIDLGPMSSMADGSALRSHSGEGCCQPWWLAWSYSFCPVATAWMNIWCIRNGKCNPWGSPQDIHQGRHWHQAAFLPPLQKCPLILPAFWWWLSLLYDCHISG